MVRENGDGNESPVSNKRGGGLRRRLALWTGIAGLAIFGPGYLPPLNPALNYEIDRSNIEQAAFDYLVRPAPRLFMEVKASGKLTHDPDWIPTQITFPDDCIKIEGDPGLLHRENFFQGEWFEVNKINFSKVQISLGAWWRVFQLGPTQSEVTNWILKFSGSGNDSGQRLRIRVPFNVKVLQGDQSYSACGEDSNGNAVKLKKSGPFPRWAPIDGISV